MAIKVDVLYTVRIKKFIKAGVIVELADGSTELVHVSNIANTYVADPGEFLIISEYYQALGVPGKAKPVELSFKYLNLRPRNASQRKRAESEESASNTKSRRNTDSSIDDMLATLRSDESSERYKYADADRKSSRRQRRNNNKRKRWC